MTDLIEKLKAAEQNTAGMFEIDEDTICKIMTVLVSEPVAWKYREYVYACGIGYVWRDKLEEERPEEQCDYITDVMPLYTR